MRGILCFRCAMICGGICAKARGISRMSSIDNGNGPQASTRRTLRLASISAASIAACAYSRRCLRVAYSGPSSQWFASPFNAASSPPVPRGRGPYPWLHPSGLAVPTYPRAPTGPSGPSDATPQAWGTSSSGSRSILMMCGGSISGAICRVAPDEVMQFMELRR